LRHLQALHHVLLDQEQCDAVAVDARDQGEEFLDQSGREAERGLIQDEQLGFGHQAAPDGQHLLLATGQRPGALALALRKAREDRKHPLAVLARRGRARRSSRGRGSRATLMLGKMRRPSGTWIRPRATIARGRARSIAAGEADRAAPRPQHAGDRAVERGFAGAVRAEHRDDLASFTARSMPRRISVAP
jgi:hypothetical protein